ncbi:MAG: DNA repair protein RecN [Ruminococcus sp.]|nr:DNA repair protein RecN [Ruminococcus sp.]
MLKELYIENLVVIEKATIDFSNGFNVFTGETGAGKSILINGINAILGQRVSKDVVRTGADKALINALFDDIGDDVKKVLSDIGIDSDDDSLVLEREITSQGKSIARINGRAVSASSLREIGSLLVDIHGQHDSIILLDNSKHLEILDSYGGLEEELSEYKKLFRELQSTSRKIKELSTQNQQRSIRIDYLKDVIDEISAVKIESENEDEEIEKEFNLADNAVSLLNSLRSSDELLSGNDTSDGAISSLEVVNDILESNSDSFSDLEPLASRLSSVIIEATDIRDELLRLSSKLEIDPNRFALVSERRDTLIKIKKKYGPTLKDVLDKLDEFENEYDELVGSYEELDKVTENRNNLLKEVSKKAKELSLKRQAAAESFTESVINELRFLNMEKVRIGVDFKKGNLTSTGLEKVEFLISVNPGEDLKPISKIASGGELSRIMLALKCVTANKDNIPVVIFDEIDTGVSGKAAQRIGKKLKELSSTRQVLCVTHLSQIAAFADKHFLIEKKMSDDKTTTSVIPLDFEQRKQEIARIMSGEKITDSTLKSAEDLLNCSK